MYRIPRYKVTLVRDSSVPSEIKNVSTPAEAAPLLRAYLEGIDREHFVVLLLDIKNKIKCRAARDKWLAKKGG